MWPDKGSRRRGIGYKILQEHRRLQKCSGISNNAETVAILISFLCVLNYFISFQLQSLVLL